MILTFRDRDNNFYTVSHQALGFGVSRPDSFGDDIWHQCYQFEYVDFDEWADLQVPLSCRNIVKKIYNGEELTILQKKIIDNLSKDGVVYFKEET